LAQLAFSWPGTSLGSIDSRGLARWCKEYFESYGGVEITADWESPLDINLRYAELGSFGLRVERAGSIKRFLRHRSQVAHDGDDRFTLIINRGGSATERVAQSRPTSVEVGASILFDRSEPSAHVCPGGSHRLVLIMPRRAALAAIPNIEDRVGIPIPAGNPALRLFAKFADRLLDDDDELTDPLVLAQAGQSLMDLAVLALGSNRDNEQVARLRGLRAARLANVLREIRLNYADPGLSPEVVAVRVGISVRTLHALLHETDACFSERVRELRLAKAFGLLCTEEGPTRSVTDAAYESGFSDLSYFIRSFRQKYGMTPTAARGRR
jgi:AraC-like DNA-binding protein